MEVWLEARGAHLASQKLRGNQYFSTPVGHLWYTCVLQCASWETQVQESDSRKEQTVSFRFQVGSGMEVCKRRSLEKTNENVFFYLDVDLEKKNNSVYWNAYSIIGASPSTNSFLLENNCIAGYKYESFPHGKTEAQREMAAVAFMEEQLERVSPSNNAVTVEGEVTVPSKMMNVSPLPLNTEVQLFYLWEQTIQRQGGPHMWQASRQEKVKQVKTPTGWEHGEAGPWIIQRTQQPFRTEEGVVCLIRARPSLSTWNLTGKLQCRSPQHMSSNSSLRGEWAQVTSLGKKIHVGLARVWNIRFINARRHVCL